MTPGLPAMGSKVRSPRRSSEMSRVRREGLLELGTAGDGEGAVGDLHAQIELGVAVVGGGALHPPGKGPWGDHVALGV